MFGDGVGGDCGFVVKSSEVGWGTMSTLDVVNLKNQVYPTLDESTKKRPLKFFFLTQANKMFLLKTKPLLFSIIAMSQNL